ncbi:unnamed protein product [Linum trigynum]|uniref:Uncharacterized protein n=1 Tax=Linum trigynum TaxID=586398 RepID=A0AAV2EMU9_9ROSI
MTLFLPSFPLHSYQIDRNPLSYPHLLLSPSLLSVPSARPDTTALITIPRRHCISTLTYISIFLFVGRDSIGRISRSAGDPNNEFTVRGVF